MIKAETVTAGEGLTKLVGTSRDGDFVHQGQQMAKEEGFRNVSRIWLKKTMTYEQGLDALEEGHAKTHDLLLTLAEMSPVVEDGRFTIKSKDGRLFRPTTHAVAQMGGWAGVSKWYVEQLLTNPAKPGGEPVFIRDAQDAETLVAALRNGFRRLEPEKKFLWRTRDDGTLRAMLSESYAIVDNRWFVDVLRSLIPGGRLSHWRGDVDTVFGNVLIPDTIREEKDSDYGGMLSVGNSEIGERRVTSCPSVFRAICMNGCIWGAKVGKSIKQVHRGKIDLAELREAIKVNLEAQIPLLPTGIDRLLKTREMLWGGKSIKPLFAQVAIEFGLSKKQATGMLEAYNQERNSTPEYARTLFSVVNAVTRAGQKLENAAWVRFDQIGGDLVGFDKEGWARLVGRANSMKSGEVDAVFASMSI